MCATRNGVSPTTNRVTVEKSRQRHTSSFCPLTKFDGGLMRLHEADEAAVDWLTTYGSWHTLIIINVEYHIFVKFQR